jgi:hypothetical protein
MTVLDTQTTRRKFVTRLGLGAGGVMLLDGGGRALADSQAPLPPSTDAKDLSTFGFMFPICRRLGQTAIPTLLDLPRFPGQLSA